MEFLNLEMINTFESCDFSLLVSRLAPEQIGNIDTTTLRLFKKPTFRYGNDKSINSEMTGSIEFEGIYICFVCMIPKLQGSRQQSH